MVAVADIRSDKKQTRCAKNKCIISNSFCYTQKLPNAYITRDKIYILDIAMLAAVCINIFVIKPC